MSSLPRSVALAAILMLSQSAVAQITGHSFEWISPDTVHTRLDGYPKFKVKVTNTGTQRSPDRFFIRFTSTDYVGEIGGFANFPNGGSIKLEPGESTIVSMWSIGVRERPVTDRDANGAFFRDIGFRFFVDDFNNPRETVVRKTITFIDPQQPMTLATVSGSMPVSATIPASTLFHPAGITEPMETRVYLRTPRATELISVAQGPANQPLNVNLSIMPRSDWHLVVDQPGYRRMVVPIQPGKSTGITYTRRPLGNVVPKYRWVRTDATPTGFWRGAVSESEGTVVVFPGQENWKTVNGQPDLVVRGTGQVLKYSFAGEKLWTHEADWEIWGGDMTPDGRWVAYVQNPAPGPRTHRMVVLDGFTGDVYWDLQTADSYSPLGRQLESVAVAISPDGQYIAVGSVASGMVTVYDRITKTTLWSAPEAPFPYTTGFGQVREMRFSPDNAFLLIGAGDGYLTKLDVVTRSIVWRAFIGGWPFVNGLRITRDFRFAYTGTKSGDLTKIDLQNGQVMWQVETTVFDSELSRDETRVASFGGRITDAQTGAYLGTAADRTHLLRDGTFVIGVNQAARTYDIGGRLWYNGESSGLATCGGCQVQWSYLSADDRYLIVAARDMVDPAPVPGPGIAFYERDPATITTDIESDSEPARPTGLRLDAAFPNPFNPSTTVRVHLPQDAQLRLTVWNVLGQRVATLSDGWMSAGTHQVRIDGSGWASGMYLIRLESDGEQRVQRILQVK
jgi:outer membrane protein assembly factor BamB